MPSGPQGLSAFEGGVHREVAVCVRTEDDGLRAIPPGLGPAWEALLGGITKSDLPPPGPLCGQASPPCRPASYFSGCQYIWDELVPLVVFLSDASTLSRLRLPPLGRQ